MKKLLLILLLIFVGCNSTYGKYELYQNGKLVDTVCLQSSCGCEHKSYVNNGVYYKFTGELCNDESKSKSNNGEFK
jgi:hypothetical protein